MGGEGSVGVYRQASGGTGRNASSWETVSFDTVVKESNTSVIEKQGSSPYSTFRLKQVGLYLVSGIQGILDNSGSGRSNVLHEITNSTYYSENGNGYVRRATGALRGYASALSIIDVSSPPVDITGRYMRDDNNRGGAAVERANKSSLSILYLGDLPWAVTDPGSTLYTPGVSWASRTWPDYLVLDSGFSFSSGTLRLDDPGTYLLWGNLPILASTSTRLGISSRFQVGGTVVENSYGHSYVKGTTDDCDTGAVGNLAVVRTTFSSQLVYVQHYKEGGLVIQQAEGCLAAVKLPDTVQVVGIHHSGTGHSLDTAGTSIALDTQNFIDSDIFTHSESTNNPRVYVDVAGDYLFIGGVQAYRASGTDIYNNILEWRKNGSALPYGHFGTFSRGGAHLTSGCSFGHVIPDLAVDDYVDLFLTKESSSTATPVPSTQSDKQGVSAIQLASLSTQDLLDYERMHRGLARGLARGAI